MRKDYNLSHEIHMIKLCGRVKPDQQTVCVDRGLIPNSITVADRRILVTFITVADRRILVTFITVADRRILVTFILVNLVLFKDVSGALIKCFLLCIWMRHQPTFLDEPFKNFIKIIQ